MPDRLRDMLDKNASIDEIGAFLDGLDPQTRTHVTTQLGRSHQAKLWQMAGKAAPLSLDDFVPEGHAPMRAVAHRGLNTLPVPHFGKKFTKWMTRSEQGVVGYNESPFAPFIGPGYFVIRPTEGEAETRHGAVVVDYYARVDSTIPEDWPWARPNWLGLQFFVYFQTLDFMRKVSTHVSIGAAYKWGRVPLGSYFVLCREPTD